MDRHHLTVILGSFTGHPRYGDTDAIAQVENDEWYQDKYDIELAEWRGVWSSRKFQYLCSDPKRICLGRKCTKRQDSTEKNDGGEF